MIEHVIANALLTDEKIKTFCGSKVYAVSAPDGTKAPYIVITESEDNEYYDVVTRFDIVIEIYDYDKDKRKIINVSQRVKKLLDGLMIDDPLGTYADVRVWFNKRQQFKEQDTTLSRMFMSFSVRASEELDNNNKP